MKTVANTWQYLLASLYACLASAFLGAVLLDVVYAHALDIYPNLCNSAAIFSQADDLLLLLGGITFLVGFGAISAAWNLPSARSLFIASLLFLTAEFLIPPFFGPFLLNLQATYNLPLGKWIRLFANAMCTALAFVALYRLHRSSS